MTKILKFEAVVAAAKRWPGGAQGAWYVGTPYSKFPGGLDEAFREASRIGGQLLSAGVSVFVPISHTHPLSEYGGVPHSDHSIWLPLDQFAMEASVGMIVGCMPTWETSYGVGHEIRYFEGKRRPILYLDPESVPHPLPQTADASTTGAAFAKAEEAMKALGWSEE